MLEEKSESGDVAPSMKPEERPNLQDYKDKESTNTNTCQDCNKVFSSTEELTAHYKKKNIQNNSSLLKENHKTTKILCGTLFIGLLDLACWPFSPHLVISSRAWTSNN